MKELETLGNELPVWKAILLLVLVTGFGGLALASLMALVLMLVV